MLSRSKSCLSVCCYASFMADLFRKKVRIRPIGNCNFSGDKMYQTWMQPICISSSLFYSVGTRGALSFGVKWPVCEANLSYCYSVEVKNGWSYTICVYGLCRHKAIQAETVLALRQFHRSRCFMRSYFNAVSVEMLALACSSQQPHFYVTRLFCCL
jgi:hypothetical protein